MGALVGSYRDDGLTVGEAPEAFLAIECSKSTVFDTACDVYARMRQRCDK